MKSKGFTLVELLVVISILLTLLSLGIASYTRFNRRQRLFQAALTLKSDLRFAQTKAISIEKPESGCSTFDGMRISFSATQYATDHLCTPEGAVGTQDLSYLPYNITFSSVPSTFTFGAGHGKTSLASDMLIVLTNGLESYGVTVSTNGNINEEGFQ